MKKTLVKLGIVGRLLTLLPIVREAGRHAFPIGTLLAPTEAKAKPPSMAAELFV